MIAFTADNHLGVNSQWSIKERGDDFLRSFGNMVSTLISDTEPNKALIIGGDLFDSVHPSSTAVAFAQKQVKLLTDAGYTVCGIDGNHDIAEGKWLGVCGVTPLSSDPLTLPGGLRVCGLNYGKSLDILAEINSMMDRGVHCDVLVLHLALGELNRMGAMSDISGQEILVALKAMGVRLVLMGHIHIRQAVVLDGITFAYCGSTEVCSMNEEKSKSFERVDPVTLGLTAVPIETRKMEHTVISTEEEFAQFEASLVQNSQVLQSLFITPDIRDGVKRLRLLGKEKNALMRIQVIKQAVEAVTPTIDRYTGIIGLEQAIELSFSPDSKEAALIRMILHSPETLKLTIDNFMQNKEADNDTEQVGA